MSEEVKEHEIQDHELEELKEGVIEAEKTPGGFRVKGKFTSFAALLALAGGIVVVLMITAAKTGIIKALIK